MPTLLIDPRLLPHDMATRVLTEYRVALKRSGRPMDYTEAAWLYGYRPDHLRRLVSNGRLKVTRKQGRVLITHVAMRNYLQSRVCSGRPRKALLKAQTSIA